MQILWDYKDVREGYSKMLPAEIPDSLLNEDHAKHVHGQTLKRLNERGGMGVEEIVLNIKRLSYSDINLISKKDAIDFIKKRLAEYTAQKQKTS